MVGRCAVVDIVVLHLKLEVSVQFEVGANAVDALHRAEACVLSIDVVSAVNLKPTGYRHSCKQIPAVCFGGRTWAPGLGFCIEILYISSRMVGIFSPKTPIIMLVDGAEGPSVAPCAYPISSPSACCCLSCSVRYRYKLRLDSG